EFHRPAVSARLSLEQLKPDSARNNPPASHGPAGFFFSEGRPAGTGSGAGSRRGRAPSVKRRGARAGGGSGVLDRGRLGRAAPAGAGAAGIAARRDRQPVGTSQARRLG